MLPMRPAVSPSSPRLVPMQLTTVAAAAPLADLSPSSRNSTGMCWIPSHSLTAFGHGRSIRGRRRLDGRRRRRSARRPSAPSGPPSTATPLPSPLRSMAWAAEAALHTTHQLQQRQQMGSISPPHVHLSPPARVILAPPLPHQAAAALLLLLLLLLLLDGRPSTRV